MNIFSKLDKLTDLTQNEKTLVCYMQDNPENFIKMSASEISKACFISTSSIYRLCKKVGLAGLAELKVQVSLSINEYLKEQNSLNFDYPFKQNETQNQVVLKMKENKFVLPEDKAKEVVEQGYLNKTVTMGIRPENIYDPKELVEVKKGAELNVKINVYELLGSEVYLYFDVEKFPVTARVNADTTARTGDMAKFIVDMEKAHVFDKETGLVITN